MLNLVLFTQYTGRGRDTELLPNWVFAKSLLLVCRDSAHFLSWNPAELMIRTRACCERSSNLNNYNWIELVGMVKCWICNWLNVGHFTQTRQTCFWAPVCFKGTRIQVWTLLFNPYPPAIITLAPLVGKCFRVHERTFNANHQLNTARHKDT